MKNKVNSFGYINEGDIKDYLLLQPNIVGTLPRCNETFKLESLKECDYKFKSFSFREAMKYTDKRLIGVVYRQLLAIDCIKQMQELLLDGKVVFCDFSQYICDDFEIDNFMEYLVSILKLRGFKVTWDSENKMLTVLNGEYGKQVKTIVNLLMKCELTNVEELLFRGCAETLARVPKYQEFNKLWVKFREACYKPNIQDSEIKVAVYNLLKMYATITGELSEIHDDLDGEQCANVLNGDSATADLFKVILQYDDIITSGEGLSIEERKSVMDSIEDSIDEIDHYFTAEMKTFYCAKCDSSVINSAFDFYFNTGNAKPRTKLEKHVVCNKDIVKACFMLVGLVAVVMLLT